MSDLFKEFLLLSIRQQTIHIVQLRYTYGCQFDEGVVMNPRAQCHDKLTIHTVHKATMSRNDRIKVLDTICTFNRRCEESSKRGHETGENGQPKGVDLNRVYIR